MIAIAISNNKKPRKGCKDVFNAFLTRGCTYEGKYDFPVSPTLKEEIPKDLIAYDLTKSSTNYDAYVHFYIDDYKFDGRRGIWSMPQETLERLKKFRGVISPDFSTYLDFPSAIKIYNFYRMRAFSFYLASNGINVINNVRWSDPSSYEYCFEGVPKNGIIAIGTIGCIREKKYWRMYQQGLDEMIKRLNPHTILVYGKAPDKFFKKHRDNGVRIIEYESQTSKAFNRGDCHER